MPGMSLNGYLQQKSPCLFSWLCIFEMRLHELRLFCLCFLIFTNLQSTDMKGSKRHHIITDIMEEYDVMA